MHRKLLNTSNLKYTMLLVHGGILPKKMAFFVPIDCVKFARYCGKMLRAAIPYSGLLNLLGHTDKWVIFINKNDRIFWIMPSVLHTNNQIWQEFPCSWI